MALSGFDFTISCTNAPEYSGVLENLKRVFKKFVFQQEKSETGYLHYQGRGHLIKPTTAQAIKGKFAETLWGAHFTPTVKGVHQGNVFNYVMKEETRVSGPWKETDSVENAPVLTRQLKVFLEKEMYPWQSQMTSAITEEDDRYINVVVDRTGGNVGKSILAEWLEYKGLAYEIPPMKDMEDLMQCAMGIPAQKCYVVDMPRGMKKDKLAGFYAGLEALKNGVMYDKRYNFKKRRIDRPQLWVFTNMFPDLSLLSPDRWIIWEMQEDKSLRRAN